jgi:hypothetical protein
MKLRRHSIVHRGRWSELREVYPDGVGRVVAVLAQEWKRAWDATDMVVSVTDHPRSIEGPVLPIHRDQDNNVGTFSIQSERHFAAIKGLGGNGKLVMLPNESHGYRARESVLRMLAETVDGSTGTSRMQLRRRPLPRNKRDGIHYDTNGTGRQGALFVSARPTMRCRRAHQSVGL